MQLRDEDPVDIIEIDAGGQALLGAEQDAVAAGLEGLAQGAALGKADLRAGNEEKLPLR